MLMPRSSIVLCVLLSCFVLLIVVGCSPAADSVPAFDGTRAFDLIKQQVEIGPRYPEVPGHEAAADFIRSQLKPYADEVSTQSFSTTIRGKALAMQNIIGVFNPGAKRWVLLAAHWDSRPTADQEVNVEKRKQPIPGANDGGSGVAVLLELARAFHKQKPSIGVMMVFLDGEDYGPDEDAMYLGAKYFAANLARSATVSGKQIKFDYGILLDMIGDKNLNIYEEQASVNAAPEVVNKVWGTADRLGYKDKFIPSVKYAIRDDHIPLMMAGIKCIDLIDFDYGPWHTLDDTPDKCSAQSLKIVGEVVARVVYDEKGD